MIRKLCLFAAIVACLAAPRDASAYWPYWGYAGYGPGWGLNYATDYVPAPPYYALHPPVYYSPFITARHYGASPFAWLPGMQPITYVPEPLPVQGIIKATGKDGKIVDTASPASVAVMIENPYVPAQTTAANPAPRSIDNPFVASASR
jgi:hypothetical protein